MYSAFAGLFFVVKVFVTCFHPCLFNLIYGCYMASETYMHHATVVLHYGA